MPCAVPPVSLPSRNRRVLLTKRLSAIPGPEHFRLEEAALPEPAEGEVLVRNIYLSVDPAQRGWASDIANYSAPVALGSVMRALAVGRVIRSRNPSLAEGEYLYGFFGWQDYAAIGADAVVHRCTQDLPLDAFASLCGINGVTAYLALTELGRPRAGDTLLVATAAGSVGSFVGQIGKSLGCRTIGLTGSDEKAEICRRDFGYDAAINYRTADLPLALAEATPAVDVLFDNTGGDILDAALRHMATGGRVVQCGTASVASWSPPPSGLRNEREVLVRRLTWSGFVIFDHLASFARACDDLATLRTSRGLSWTTDLKEGIEHAPGALAALYRGENVGKSLIYVG